MGLFGSASKAARFAVGAVGMNMPGVPEWMNYKAGQENLDWQKSVQEQTWAREDNAVQRRAADLKAAGLSPVLAAGSAAQAGPVVSTQAPTAEPGRGHEAAAAVMQMLKAKVDISRTEAETEAIKAQADRTRVQSDIDQQLLKFQPLRSESELGLIGANTTAARVQAALHGVEAERERHDLKLSEDAGVATRPGWLGDVLRTLTGQSRSVQGRRVTEAINRAAQSNLLISGRAVIKNEDQANIVRDELQRMRNRGVSALDSRYVRLQQMLIRYNNRREK